MSAKREHFRSGLEYRNAVLLESKGITYEYEQTKIPYQKKVSTYLVDFELPNGIIIETKGYMSSADRSKHLLIKEQHPHLDIRFVFSNARNKLNKRSNTTYGEWATKHGFQWAEKTIPESWLY